MGRSLGRQVCGKQAARCGGRLVRCPWHHADRMAWTMVAVAGLLEIVWAVLLKQSEGFSKLWPSPGFFAAGTGSIVLLALALRTLPVGSATPHGRGSARWGR